MQFRLARICFTNSGLGNAWIDDGVWLDLGWDNSSQFIVVLIHHNIGCLIVFILFIYKSCQEISYIADKKQVFFLSSLNVVTDVKRKKADLVSELIYPRKHVTRVFRNAYFPMFCWVGEAMTMMAQNNNLWIANCFSNFCSL